MELAELNIAIIVQARMGSTRLPGKVMLPLNGSPVLEHVLERCAKIAGRDKVICAGIDSPEEQPIKALCERLKISFFAGDEKDVLSRYYHAAKKAGAEWVMRITSDCPLIDPVVCRGLIRQVLEDKADYGLTLGWPHGLDCEVFSFSVLNESYDKSSKPQHREHVTLWAKTFNNYNKITYSPAISALELSWCRWVIDYPEDYDFLKLVFSKMNITPSKIQYWENVYKFLKGNMSLCEINKKRITDWAINNDKIIGDNA